MKRIPALSSRFSPWLACVLGCLFCLSIYSAAQSQSAPSAAGTLIRNVATASYTKAGVSETSTSDEVITRIVSICDVAILPNGSLDAPAYELGLSPNETAYLPYVLTNTGNDAHTFDLEALTDSGLMLTIILDQNANGVRDEGEPEISSLNAVPANESVQLLLAVTGADPGTFYVNVAGACQAAQGAARDDDNISLVRVEPLFEGAGGQPVKEADPVSGSAVYPGAELSYSLSFSFTTARSDVSVTDALSPLLGEPSNISEGLIVDEETGLETEAAARYDPATRTLLWDFASVPAGMTVRLSFDVRVQELEDLAPETRLENTALVSGPGLEPAVTNTVFHDLRPVLIDLEKTASPASAAPGDTLDYTLKVSNPQQNPSFDSLSLTDLLPDTLTYLADSSLVTLPSGETLRLEPTPTEAGLLWTLPGLEPGEILTLTFRARINVNAAQNADILNRATVAAENAAGRSVAEAVAAVTTELETGVLSAAPVLLGTVFVDHNRSGVYERAVDTPLEDVRLYLSDGSSVLSDANGRYIFMDLRPGLASLRVDPLSAPPRFYRETSTETKEGLWRLRLNAGLIVRQDIPFEAPVVRLNVSQTLRVETGPVTLEKSVVSLPDGRAQVRLELSISEALSSLIIEDALPAGVANVSEPRLAAEAATVAFETNDFEAIEAGLELNNTPANFTASFVYDLDSAQPESLLLAPRILWEQP